VGVVLEGREPRDPDDPGVVEVAAQLREPLVLPVRGPRHGLDLDERGPLRRRREGAALVLVESVERLDGLERQRRGGTRDARAKHAALHRGGPGLQPVAQHRIDLELLLLGLQQTLGQAVQRRREGIADTQGRHRLAEAALHDPGGELRAQDGRVFDRDEPQPGLPPLRRGGCSRHAASLVGGTASLAAVVAMGHSGAELV